MATPSLEQAKQLLEAAQFIASHRAQVAGLSGANFNVFRVLRMEGDEVRLHSRFIAELLDPRGSHGQGSAFLEMFLRQVECSLPSCSRVDANKARLEAPHYIGPTLWKDEDSMGGSIDIFITDDARHISIENKIHHGEGDHQVDRYCNYRPESNFVLFLTPDGRRANTKKSNYATISYGEYIVPWLEGCHKHCTDLPALRESIKQYLVVVRELTGGDPLMQETNEEAKRLLRQNMEAAHLVYRHFEPTLHEAVEEFAGKLREALEAALEEKHRLGPGPWKTQNNNWPDRSSGVMVLGVDVWSEAWPNGAEFWWVKWQYRKGRFEYGLWNPHRKGRNEIESRLGERVGELKFLGSHPWAFYKRMDISIPRLEENVNALAKLFDEQEQTALVTQVACELIEFVVDCDRKFRESAS